MYAINLFIRSTWEYIASLGKVISVEARGSHYVEVNYEHLTTLGVAHFTNNKESVLSNGIVTMAGFSVSYNSTDPKEIEVRDDLLSLSQTIIHVSKMAKLNIYRLHDIVKCDVDNIKYDFQRGSHSITNGTSIFVFYGAETMLPSWSESLLEVHDVYKLRLANNRVNWFNWLKESEYVPKTTGCVYKFPNGLTVKMDNGNEPLCEDGRRIYCETLDSTNEISRFECEETFLVWLTKYF